MSDARAILSVRFGPLDGRRAVIAPGSAIRVGRTAPAGLLVPHDGHLSAVHFEVAWDGARGRLRDLESARGTFLDGRRVTDADLGDGAWIRAGDTLFNLRVEGATARPCSPDERASEALSRLRAEPAPLFAVLDAARDARALAILRESVEEHASLFEGAKGARLSEAAPYLVSLPVGSALLDRLLCEGWGRSWGIYLTSKRPFKEVRKHLRRIQMVNVEGLAHPVYFRFYDPRVLRPLLPSCSPRQAAEMFGDVESFLMEGERGELLRFSAPR